MGRSPELAGLMGRDEESEGRKCRSGSEAQSAMERISWLASSQCPSGTHGANVERR